MHTDLDARLQPWAQQHQLRPIDVAFTRFLAQQAPDTPLVWLQLAALVSQQLGHGHVCLDLSSPPSGLLTQLPPWHEIVASLPPQLVSSGPGHTPLVLDQQRLYLRRYWHCEQRIRHHIDQRLQRPATLPGQASVSQLREWLDTLFPTTPGGPQPNWQKLACALAARSAFSIITGGPGTGKTTTVVRLLAVLQGLSLPRPLRIRLAAPTGKAAARLNESIASAVAALPAGPQGEHVQDAIPTRVTTLHRLLGSRPDSRHFRHHALHPLPLDVLVIDEASMVDLEMMHAVLEALPPQARLVLLGDKDQLASVEAGAVLGQLCAHAEQGGYWPDTANWLQQTCGETVGAHLIAASGSALNQSIAMLRHSFRFNQHSGIGQLAHAINSGDAPAAQALLQQAQAPGIARLPVRSPLDPSWRQLVQQGYQTYINQVQKRPPHSAPLEDFQRWAHDVLNAHKSFQVLCALREGPWGVTGLNQRIQQWLQEAGGIQPDHEWYLGRPVLVTGNDYGLGLMNGDIGITLCLPVPTPAGANEGWSLRVAFAASDGSDHIRWILPSRLQAVETVYAMTVHKSQGSEFGHTTLVLPDQPAPILTRELIYTGITRAKKQFTLVQPSPPALLAQAIAQRTQRAGGLWHMP